jgi:hypothetical protein
MAAMVGLAKSLACACNIPASVVRARPGHGRPVRNNPMDDDYGRLLDRVCVKGLASPTRLDRLYFEGPLAA